jgi:hypothetical protein
MTSWTIILLEYAQQKGKDLDIQKEELKAFLGILVIMGFHQLPNLRMYWSTDGNLHVQRIADIMPIKRFLSILRLLHLNDNTTVPKKVPPTSINYTKCDHSSII